MSSVCRSLSSRPGARFLESTRVRGERCPYCMSSGENSSAAMDVQPVAHSGQKDALAHRQEGRSAGGVTGGEHGAEMDVTRYTYNPLNPYQGPREASERADLLLPGLGGKGHCHQAAMLGLDQPWMAVSLTPAGYSSHAAGPCNERATAIGAAGVKRSWTDSRHAHWPASRSHWRNSQAGNACPRFVPNAVHAMRAEPLDSGCQHAAPSTR